MDIPTMSELIAFVASTCIFLSAAAWTAERDWVKGVIAYVVGASIVAWFATMWITVGVTAVTCGVLVATAFRRRQRGEMREAKLTAWQAVAFIGVSTLALACAMR